MYNHCGCFTRNGYRHPNPMPKKHRFLDTVKVEKFTVKRVGESCVDECCEPMPAGIEVKNSCLIFTGITECIRPDVYYTFDIDRTVPIDYNALQVFIKAEPCETNFRHGAVELEETTVVVPYRHEHRFKFTEDSLCRYYQAKYRREEHEDGDHCCHPHRVEEFIEVDLDLRGNIATSGYFTHSNSLWRDPVYGPKHRYVLYMNNAGRLVLTRNRYETRAYGDFDL